MQPRKILKVKPIHYLMLKYWHRMANHELKEHYRLPEVGETIEGLERRNLSTLDIFTIEECYEELRELIKTQYGQTIDMCH
jgi:hypothetical protein